MSSRSALASGEGGRAVRGWLGARVLVAITRKIAGAKRGSLPGRRGEQARELREVADRRPDVGTGPYEEFVARFRPPTHFGRPQRQDARETRFQRRVHGSRDVEPSPYTREGRGHERSPPLFRRRHPRVAAGRRTGRCQRDAVGDGEIEAAVGGDAPPDREQRRRSQVPDGCDSSPTAPPPVGFGAESPPWVSRP